MKLTLEPNLLSQGTTFASRYESLGTCASPDPEGGKVNYAIPYSAGVVQEVITLESSRELRILSRSSQLSAQSLADIWQRDLLPPQVEGASLRPSMSDQIVIFGGWRRWRNLSDVDQGIQEDALWRATPRGVWELVIRKMSQGIEGQIPDAPRAVKKTMNARETGGQPERRGSIGEAPREQATIPDLQCFYPDPQTMRTDIGPGEKGVLTKRRSISARYKPCFFPKFA